MNLLIDTKKFKAGQSQHTDYIELSIDTSDIMKTPEDLEHIIAFLLESYPREEIKKQLRALGLLEEK